MNQANLSKLMSKLRFKVVPHVHRFRNPDGPEGRMLRMRKLVTGLIKHERIELSYPTSYAVRCYAERLISDAIRHGDSHRSTMEMADHWLLEKQLVHKLFKVLVPRFQNYNVAYTKMYKAPRPTSGPSHKRSVLELRGNIYPPLVLTTNSTVNRNLIHNVLLEEARKEYNAKKALENSNDVTPTLEETNFENEAAKEVIA